MALLGKFLEFLSAHLENFFLYANIYIVHFGGADRAIRECGRGSEDLVWVGLVLLLTIRLKTSESKHVLTS